MTRHIHVIGYPGSVGGALTELWHTVKLWRGRGWDVTLIPTWKADPDWRHRLDEIGCRTLDLSPLEFRLPPGSTVVSFCNAPFLTLAPRLADCHTVWVPCMNYLMDDELRLYRDSGRTFDAYVFQTRYQYSLLRPQLEKVGVRPFQCHVIPGAFDVSEFPFRFKRHKAREPFVVGRLSRSDPRKFSADTWQIYSKIPNVRARVMGWSETVEAKLGSPPPWAEVLPPGAESTADFLGSLHALVHAGGEAVENYPRFVLEAMAAGVPVVTDRAGGLPEMVGHGSNGVLCQLPSDFALHTSILAARENWREHLVRMARDEVTRLADPSVMGRAWDILFRR